MKTLFAFFQRRPVSLFAVLLLLLLLGARAGLSLPRFSQSRRTEAVVRLSLHWSSWPAEQVRNLLCLPIEEALAAFGQITRIRSVCTDAQLHLYLRCASGSDVYALREELAAALDALRPNLPHDIGLFELTVQPDAAETVFTFAVLPVAEAADLALLRESVERELGTRLARLDGAHGVSILGGAEQECRIHVDERRAARYGVDLFSLQNALAMRTRDISLGSITDGQRELSVLLKGLENELSALAELSIGPGGLRLQDVATLELRERPLESAAVLNGQDAVFVSVSLAAGLSSKRFYRRARPYLQEFRLQHEDYYQIVVLNTEAASSWLDLCASGGLLLSVAALLFLLSWRVRLLRYFWAASLSLLFGLALSLLLLDLCALPLDAISGASFVYAAVVALLLSTVGTRLGLRLAAAESYKAARSFVCCVPLFALPLVFHDRGFFAQAGAALLVGASFCAAAVFCSFLVCPVVCSFRSGLGPQLSRNSAPSRRIWGFGFVLSAVLAVGCGVLLFSDDLWSQSGEGTGSRLVSTSSAASVLSLGATLSLPPSSLEARNAALRTVGSQLTQLSPDGCVSLSSVPEAEDFTAGFPAAALFPGHRVQLSVYAASKAKAAALRPHLADYLRQQEAQGAFIVIEESAALAPGSSLAVGIDLPEYEYAVILADTPAQLEERVGLLYDYSAGLVAESDCQPIALLPPSSAQVLHLRPDTSRMARYGVDPVYLASLLASQIQDEAFADFRMKDRKLPLSLSLSSSAGTAGGLTANGYTALLARAIPLSGGQGPRLGELLLPDIQSRASHLLRLGRKDVYALRYPWKASLGSSLPRELALRFPWILPLCELEAPPSSLRFGSEPQGLIGRISLSVARVAILVVGTACAFLCLLGLAPRLLLGAVLGILGPLAGGHSGAVLALSLQKIPASISFTVLNAILVFAVCTLVCVHFIFYCTHLSAAGQNRIAPSIEANYWLVIGALSLLLLAGCFLCPSFTGDLCYLVYVLSSYFSVASLVVLSLFLLFRLRPKKGNAL